MLESFQKMCNRAFISPLLCAYTRATNIWDPGTTEPPPATNGCSTHKVSYRDKAVVEFHHHHRRLSSCWQTLHALNTWLPLPTWTSSIFHRYLSSHGRAIKAPFLTRTRAQQFGASRCSRERWESKSGTRFAAGRDQAVLYSVRQCR